jgi:hypothetical protein
LSIFTFFRAIIFSDPVKDTKDVLHRILPFLGVFRARLVELQQERLSGVFALDLLVRLYEALLSLRASGATEVLQKAEETLGDHGVGSNAELLSALSSLNSDLKRLRVDPSGRRVPRLRKVTLEDIYLGKYGVSFPLQYWKKRYEREGMTAEIRLELEGAYQWLDQVTPLIKTIVALEKLLE